MQRFYFGKKSVWRMRMVHPALRAIAQRALEITPIDFGIPSGGGLRSARRQHEMFLKKKSKCDGVKIKSLHQSQPTAGFLDFGHALDVYAYVNGKASWKKHHLSMIAASMFIAYDQLHYSDRLKNVGDRPQNFKLIWGGNFGKKPFSGWDMPHFEIKFLEGV